MPRYAELIYNGFWFSARARDAAGAIDKSQAKVDGDGAAEALQGQQPEPSNNPPQGY
jgi:argininosuccinate synthase